MRRILILVGLTGVLLLLGCGQGSVDSELEVDEVLEALDLDEIEHLELLRSWEHHDGMRVPSVITFFDGESFLMESSFTGQPYFEDYGTYVVDGDQVVFGEYIGCKTLGATSSCEGKEKLRFKWDRTEDTLTDIGTGRLYTPEY